MAKFKIKCDFELHVEADSEEEVWERLEDDLAMQNTTIGILVCENSVIVKVAEEDED
jgi:hypothetical protein